LKTFIFSKFDQCGFSKEIEKNIKVCLLYIYSINIFKLRKYEFPTPIQRAVIPLMMRSRRIFILNIVLIFFNIIEDIMGHAQTGSGKTAAFILPIINEIQRIVDLKRNNLGNKANSLVNKDSPYCIILSPTRELAQQLYEETRSFVASL